MDNASKTTFKNIAVNFFGGLGYLACIVQWLWAILLFFEPIKDFVKYITPSSEEGVVSVVPITSNVNNSTTAIISVIVTIIVIGFSIYVVAKIPAAVAKNSKKLVHEVAENTTPLIIKMIHQKKSEKVKLKLTVEIISVIKLILIALPIILTLTSKLLEKQILDPNISFIVSLCLAGVSIFWFAIEYILAKIIKIKFSELW